MKCGRPAVQDLDPPLVGDVVAVAAVVAGPYAHPRPSAVPDPRQPPPSPFVNIATQGAFSSRTVTHVPKTERIRRLALGRRRWIHSLPEPFACRSSRSLRRQAAG